MLDFMGSAGRLICLAQAATAFFVGFPAVAGEAGQTRAGEPNAMGCLSVLRGGLEACVRQGVDGSLAPGFAFETSGGQVEGLSKGAMVSEVKWIGWGWKAGLEGARVPDSELFTITEDGVGCLVANVLNVGSGSFAKDLEEAGGIPARDALAVHEAGHCLHAVLRSVSGGVSDHSAVEREVFADAFFLHRIRFLAPTAFLRVEKALLSGRSRERDGVHDSSKPLKAALERAVDQGGKPFAGLDVCRFGEMAAKGLSLAQARALRLPCFAP